MHSISSTLSFRHSNESNSSPTLISMLFVATYKQRMCNIFGTGPHSAYTTVGRVQELNLQTSYLFDINCHFHAIYATLFNIRVHLKL